MNDDIIMTKEGDLFITDDLDIGTTQSMRQAIIIRLRWFLNEWKYNPNFGVDYYGKVFVKAPNSTLILNMLHDQILTVNGVKNVENLTLDIDRRTRKATIKYKVLVSDEKTWEQELGYQSQITPSIYVTPSQDRLTFKNLASKARVHDSELIIDDEIEAGVIDELLEMTGKVKDF